MKYLLPLVSLLLASCAALVPPASRVDMVLRNSTERTIELRAHAGIFGRKLTLMPGEVWHGWVLRDFVVKEIKIDVKDKPD